MAGKPTDAGKAFLQQVIDKHVAADQREAVSQQFLGNEGLVTAIGEGVLQRGDYTRLATEAKNTVDANVAWRNEKLPVVANAEAILGKFAPGRTLTDDISDILEGNLPVNNGNPNPVLNPFPAVDPKKMADEIRAQVLTDVGKEIDNRERGAASFIAAVTDLATRHQETFGKRLDTKALIANPRVYEIGLDAAYQETFQPDFDAKATADLNAKLEAAKAEGKQLGIAEMQARIGSSVHPTAALSSRNPVMAQLEESRAASITTPDAPARPFLNRVSDAELGAEYNRLQQAGFGAGQT